MQRRNRGDAQIDFVAAHCKLDATVLWKPPLRDIEHRHDLDARYDGSMKSTGGGLGLLQHAIIAIPNPKPILKWVNVDIRGARLDCLRDQLIYEANDGRFARQILQAF